MVAHENTGCEKRKSFKIAKSCKLCLTKFGKRIRGDQPRGHRCNKNHKCFLSYVAPYPGYDYAVCGTCRDDAYA